MKVPREFQTALFHFIDSELRSGDPISSSVELAERCGDFTRRWFGFCEIGIDPSMGIAMELVSWSQRLGKHVGEFFLNNKEG